MSRSKPTKRKPARKRSLSVGDLRSKAAQALRSLREGSRRPILITEDGRPAAVLITLEDFDRLRQHDRFIGAVREGLEDSEAGRLIDDETLSRQIEAEFGSPNQP